MCNLWDRLEGSKSCCYRAGDPSPPAPDRSPPPPLSLAGLAAAAEFSPDSIPDWVFMGKQRPTAQEDLDYNYRDVALMNSVGKVGMDNCRAAWVWMRAASQQHAASQHQAALQCRAWRC